jgi:hypothetical protein
MNSFLLDDLPAYPARMCETHKAGPWPDPLYTSDIASSGWRLCRHSCWSRHSSSGMAMLVTVAVAATAEAVDSPHISDAGYCRRPLVLPPQLLLEPLHTDDPAFPLFSYSGYQSDSTALVFWYCWCSPGSAPILVNQDWAAWGLPKHNYQQS